MRMIKNSSGLTLVELLATIVILSIVTAIVSSILFSGMTITKKAENKALIQQEANYISTLLKELHEDGVKYGIKLNAERKIVITNLITKKSTTYGNDRFEYEVAEIINACPDDAIDCTESIDIADGTNQLIINPLEDNFHVRLKLAMKENPIITYEITTILSRM